jgi:hypothetical protein
LRLPSLLASPCGFLAFFVPKLGRNKTQKAASPPLRKTAASSVLNPLPAYAWDALRNGTSYPGEMRWRTALEFRADFVNQRQAWMLLKANLDYGLDYGPDQPRKTCQPTLSFKAIC